MNEKYSYTKQTKEFKDFKGYLNQVAVKVRTTDSSCQVIGQPGARISLKRIQAKMTPHACKPMNKK